MSPRSNAPDIRSCVSPSPIAITSARNSSAGRLATAVAGAILGINPFDQPDVEASKSKTRELTAAYEKTGKLPAETPLFEETALRLFADEKNCEALGARRGYAWRNISRRISLGCGPATIVRCSPMSNATSAIADALQDIAPDGPRPQAGRDLPRLRAAFPPFDRAGLQGRPEHRRVPADHLR